MEVLRDVETIASPKMKGRKTGTKGNERARDYITKRLEKENLNYRIHEFNIGKSEVSGQNIIVEIAANSKPRIVLTAHYDHIGRVGKNTYLGADDNASGVGAGLYIASVLNGRTSLEYPVWIVFTDAEELGLAGSKALVEDFQLNESNTLININLDMIGRSKHNEIYACGANIHRQFKEVLEETYNTGSYSMKIKYGHDLTPNRHDFKVSRLESWLYQSDHANFFVRGIPFIYFGVERHEDYHGVGDTYEKINTTFFLSVCDFIYAFMQKIQSSDML